MKWRSVILLLVMLISIVGITAHYYATEAEVPKPTSFLERILLLAGDNSASNEADTRTPTQLENRLKRKLTEEEIRAFQHTDKGQWKTFQDEFIRFEIPDNPLIQVQVVETQVNNSIQVAGGVASMADNRFERAYWIKVGESMHYGAILLEETDWLDEGICLCGSIAFKKCVVQDGTLLEFSLLESGEIKKVQALGARHRAVLFEWTHSVIPQSSYFRIGSSLRLQEPSPRTTEAWQVISEEKRGWMGRIAWLEKGISSEEVEMLLGKPTQIDKNQWVYVHDHWSEYGNGYKITTKIGFQRGHFKELASDYMDGEELPPKDGTVAWADNLLKELASMNLTGEQLEADRARNMPIMVDLFLKHAPDATEKKWSYLTGMVSSMADLGWKDERLLEIVHQRFTEPGFAEYNSVNILKAYDCQDIQDLVSKCLDVELTKPAGEQIWLSPLMRELTIENPAFTRLVTQLSIHSERNVRSDAYELAVKLPPPEAIKFLLKALTDNEVYIRQFAAEKLSVMARASDVFILQKHVDGEQDPNVKKSLQAAIEAAKSRA